ncbi:MAG: PilN domain-containing protein [Vicinamibacterales bacterium]
MIRINLLAVERGTAKRAALIPAAHRVTIAASLIVLGTVLGIGWWYWSLRQTSQQIDDDLGRANTEITQLQSVLTQVQQFEARKAQLEQRVTLIEQLRRGQAGPVHILDEISKALPDRLWLVEMTQQGENITLAGMTTSLTGLSDFVANLETSTWFHKPVEIIDSQVVGDRTATELVQFSVRARVNNPEAPAPLPPAAEGRR